MTKATAAPRPADELHPQPAPAQSPEPSTRRVASGPPSFESRGGPNFSTSADDVFEALKRRINRLWDQPDDIEAKKAVLTDKNP